MAKKVSLLLCLMSFTMQKNLMVSGLGLTASLVAGMLRPMPSVAGETCNFLNRNLRMAQAAQNEQQVWVSEGWWVIEPGNCVTYADNVSTYFKDNAATRDLENAASKVTLCVVNDRFAVFQADSPEACGMAGGQMATFLNPGTSLEILEMN